MRRSVGNPQLKKKGSKKTACKTTFSDDNSGHGTPDTGDLKERNGPGEIILF
jgi:hypothetical protein